MSYPKIIVAPPGPKARDIIKSEAAYSSLSTSHLYPAVFDSANECIVKDVDGNEFIDFDSAGGIMNVGHNHPQVLSAIREQLGKSIHYGYGGSYYELLVQLSKAIDTILPSGKRRFFYSNSGSEAIEAGMKTAAWHTRGQTFIGFTGSTHGRTLGALSLSGANPIHKKHFPTLVKNITISSPNCYRCPCGLESVNCGSLCLNELENHLSTDVSVEDIAALALEPIQSEGCIIPPEVFFKRLQKLTKEHDILILSDEVLTGIGRTGRWFGLDNWGVVPDIICFSGSISSGIPLGVTAARDELMDWEPGSHASSLGGNPLACAAALAVLEIVRVEHLLENATRQGRYMLRRLQEFVDKYPILGEARGRGLLLGLEIIKEKETKEPNLEDARQIALKSWRRGVLCQVIGPSTLRFCPPLNISEPLIDAGLGVIETAVREVAEG
jgi:4-aminobutyrate aminotransferase